MVAEQEARMSGETGEAATLEATINHYNTVEIRDNSLVGEDHIKPEHFRGMANLDWFIASLITCALEKLAVSLSQWRNDGCKGVFLELEVAAVALISVAVRQGFRFHHATVAYHLLGE